MARRWTGTNEAGTRRARGRWSGRPNALSGFELPLPHSIGSIEEEVKALHTDMMTFGQELHDQLFLQDDAHQAFDVPRPGIPSEKIALYAKVWRPLMAEWLRFHEDHASSFWQNLPFGGAWDHVQDFRSRLIRIRDEAKKEKFKLQTPDPIPPKDTGPDVAKIALYAGVGIAGLVAITLLVRR